MATSSKSPAPAPKGGTPPADETVAPGPDATPEVPASAPRPTGGFIRPV